MTKNPTKETIDQQKNREMIESIASNLINLARAIESLVNGPLKRKALVILLAHSSGQTQNAVDQILKALENLQADWLNKK